MLNGKGPGLKFRKFALLALLLTLRTSTLKFQGLHVLIYHKKRVKLEISHKIPDKIDVWSFNLHIWGWVKWQWNCRNMAISYCPMATSYGSPYLGWSWPIRHDWFRGFISLLTVSLLHFSQLQLAFLQGQSRPTFTLFRLCNFKGQSFLSLLNWKSLEKDSSWHSLDHTFTSAKQFHQSTITGWKWITLLPADQRVTIMWMATVSSLKWCWTQKN